MLAEFQTQLDQIKNDVSAVNESITTDDPNKIREALERLKNSSMEIGKAIYSQQQTSGDQGQQQQEKPEGENTTEGGEKK